jgi:homotetrameric cytidine deaminase
VRLLGELGCGAVLLSNAAGGIAERLGAGSLMRIDDHLNLMGDSPLRGPATRGPRFPDMTQAYDAHLAQLCEQAARDGQVTLERGVYAALLGPSYETPAEIRMLAALGADAVGMSTVPEVIALRQMGVRVGAVSCITNLAAGRSKQPLSHAEVEATASPRRLHCPFQALDSAGGSCMTGDGLLQLDELGADELALVQAARSASERAYARYSGYRVGAAVRSDDGRIFTGSNVENASYGATMCAERSAIFGLVSAGARAISAVCVYAPAEPMAMPCGMCRQVMIEFCSDAPVLVAGPRGVLRRRLAALLPEAFVLPPAGGSP